MSAEYEFEPIPGLPGHLPQGESILWQGGSNWLAFARDVLHVRIIVLYFGLLMAWRFAFALANEGSLWVAVQGAAWAFVLGACVLAIMLAFAAASAWTTFYTITNRRVVIRYGVAYQIALNLPFSRIDAANIRVRDDGTGDIPMQLRAGEHVAYLNLWPHVRSWHFMHPQPTLRSVTDAVHVAQILGQALDRQALERAVPVEAAAVATSQPARKRPVRIPIAAVAPMAAE